MGVGTETQVNVSRFTADSVAQWVRMFTAPPLSTLIRAISSLLIGLLFSFNHSLDFILFYFSSFLLLHFPSSLLLRC